MRHHLLRRTSLDLAQLGPAGMSAFAPLLGEKRTSTPTLAPRLKLGPIGACLIRASLFLFQRISHKRLVLMRFLRSLASEKSAGLQDHTTSPSASATFVFVTSASTASHRNVRDDRDPPLFRVRRPESNH